MDLFSIESNRALEEIFDEQGLELSDEIIIRREILQTVGASVVSMDRWLIFQY